MSQSPDEDKMTEADEAMVDAFLNAAEDTIPDRVLHQRILSDFDAVARARRMSGDAGAMIGTLFERFRMATAGALAGFCGLGIVAGAATANVSNAVTPEYEFAVYADDAYQLASFTSEEEGGWAAE